MKLIVLNDIKKRGLFKKFEIRRVLSNAIIRNLLLPVFCRRSFCFLFVFYYPKYSSFACYRNRCFVTSTARSIRVFSGLVLSRQQLVKYFSNSSFFPVKKASS